MIEDMVETRWLIWICDFAAVGQELLEDSIQVSIKESLPSDRNDIRLPSSPAALNRSVRVRERVE